jgi:hypothetical protein
MKYEAHFTDGTTANLWTEDIYSLYELHTFLKENGVEINHMDNQQEPRFVSGVEKK